MTSHLPFLGDKCTQIQFVVYFLHQNHVGLYPITYTGKSTLTGPDIGVTMVHSNCMDTFALHQMHEFRKCKNFIFFLILAHLYQADFHRTALKESITKL